MTGRVRDERGTPGVVRHCENPQCEFHDGPLFWAGRPLELVRYRGAWLCPNCKAVAVAKGAAERRAAGRGGAGDPGDTPRPEGGG
jgi:hypothetical protein